MKYKVKTNMFESARCVFDGYIAVSYDWYVFARRMADNTWLFTSCNYSMQTGRHIREVQGLLRGETINYVYAPNGLSSPVNVRAAIEEEIRLFEGQLANKRNRNLEPRRARLADLQSQLLIVEKWESQNV